MRSTRNAQRRQTTAGLRSHVLLIGELARDALVCRAGLRVTEFLVGEPEPVLSLGGERTVAGVSAR